MTDHVSGRQDTAEINGTRIAYELAGSGPVVVLLHAGICDRRMWDAQWAAFTARNTVLRYDMRGYGATPMVAGAFSHRADLHGLLLHLGIERAALLGCSQGGSTVMDFALEHPAMVSALVVACSSASGHLFTGDPPRQYAEIHAADAAGDIERVNELEAQIWVDGPDRAPSEVDPEVRRQVLEMNLIALRNESEAQGEPQPLDPPAATRLGDLRAPLLVIIGDRDQPAVISACEQIAAEVPGAQKAVIAGTAHLPNMERPDEFNRVVVEFLDHLGDNAILR